MEFKHSKVLCMVGIQIRSNSTYLSSWTSVNGYNIVCTHNSTFTVYTKIFSFFHLFSDLFFFIYTYVYIYIFFCVQTHISYVAKTHLNTRWRDNNCKNAISECIHTAPGTQRERDCMDRSVSNVQIGLAEKVRENCGKKSYVMVGSMSLLTRLISKKKEKKRYERDRKKYVKIVSLVQMEKKKPPNGR